MTGTRFHKRFKFKNNHTYETQSQKYICTCTYTHMYTHIHNINTCSCTSCFCQRDANLESSWKRELLLKACLHHAVCRQICGTFSLLMIKVESPSPLGVVPPQVSCSWVQKKANHEKKASKQHYSTLFPSVPASNFLL